MFSLRLRTAQQLAIEALSDEIVDKFRSKVVSDEKIDWQGIVDEMQ